MEDIHNNVTQQRYLQGTHSVSTETSTLFACLACLLGLLGFLAWLAWLGFLFSTNASNSGKLQVISNSGSSKVARTRIIL